MAGSNETNSTLTRINTTADVIITITSDHVLTKEEKADCMLQIEMTVNKLPLWRLKISTGHVGLRVHLKDPW